MEVTAGIFLASILLKEMRYLVYVRYLWSDLSETEIYCLSDPSELMSYRTVALSDAFSTHVNQNAPYSSPGLEAHYVIMEN